jgi:hypothetical protein
MNKIVELFGIHKSGNKQADWGNIVKRQPCPFLGRKCLKTRKSHPDISIGTCVVSYGEENQEIIICPIRLLERRQVFVDCIHLLTLHEPGNELHIIPEVNLPGGSVDYFLVSAQRRKVKDFLGIELQTLDTTGTVWPQRQRFLRDAGVHVKNTDVECKKSFGMNWKMTAKTTLVQLHHKIATFESLHKHLVLVVQDCLLNYIQGEFSFNHVGNAKLGDPMHFHSYRFFDSKDGNRLELFRRLSTDTNGIAMCMGLLADANIELEEILATLEGKISDKTVFNPA